MSKKTNTASTSTKFQKWAKVFIWVMLFAMVGSVVISAIYSLIVNL